MDSTPIAKTLPKPPRWPVALPRGQAIYGLSTSGEITNHPPRATSSGEAQILLTCFTPALLQIWPGSTRQPHFADLMELYAFIYPNLPAAPTMSGLLKALGMPPASGEDLLLAAWDVQDELLDILSNLPPAYKERLAKLANGMNQPKGNWVWAEAVLDALGEKPYEDNGTDCFHAWAMLPEWEERPAPGPGLMHPVPADAAAKELSSLVSVVRPDSSEARDAQQIYSRFMTRAFDAPEDLETPQLVLAEAGTGVGKTLGYLAPSRVWARENSAQVWVSTYTKALQRQINSDLTKLGSNRDATAAFPLPYAVRKGRENYLCLLNFDDLVKSLPTTRTPRSRILAGLLARWIETTNEGDFTGSDFPSWLSALFGSGAIGGLADRRGECIYAGCPHFKTCFGEHAIRKSQEAQLVVSNHALTLLQAAHQPDNVFTPTRTVFDEGHHLFHAADSVFSIALTGQNGFDLRRWLLGADTETRKNSRLRGLKRRLEELIAGNDKAEHTLNEVIRAATILPGSGWLSRIQQAEGVSVFEAFLGAVNSHVLARARDPNPAYSIEAPLFPPTEILRETGDSLRQGLAALQTAMLKLSGILRKELADDDGALDPITRNRLDTASESLQLRAEMVIGGWINLLDQILSGETSPAHVDWVAVTRDEGSILDLGAFRNWVDPMYPFAQTYKKFSHGVAITSASLRDTSLVNEDAPPILSWHGAYQQTGALELNPDPAVISLPSPFPYPDLTRVLVVSDVNKDDPEQVAAAYLALFKAAGGSALGLFTAIQRLKAVYQRISGALREADMPLYAQHIDPMDTGTLVDIFREEERACLLGTDALRDGIDVPGDALRLLVFDRVPWPRANILHQARKKHFGGQGYDDRLTRAKLKQAYGRLVRTENDRGVFVMLDNQTPSRLFSAFPPGVEIKKTGLADAVQIVRDFLGEAEA